MTVEKEKNGKLSFVNAGHCLAAMCKKDGVFTIQKDKHSMTSGLLSVLNEDPLLSPPELCAKVRERINDFMGDAEQFDDITTLCVRYKHR